MDNPPRLIYYQDAHHFHAKQLDPPVSLRELKWPVDELLGTGVDVLCFGLGYGDVYFHDSKVGRVVGDDQEVWNSHIDWRIMRMVRDARAMGTDQLRVVIEHGRQRGLRVFPSLKLQSCDQVGSDRCGKLKWDRANEVCMLEKDEAHPRYEWCYDWMHPLVREDKLSILREATGDYGADGIELDFMFVPRFFKSGDEKVGTPVMTQFVADVRKLADEIGAAQNRHVSVCARVFDQRDANLKLGLDVESWLSNGSLDMVVGQMSEQLFDTAGFDVGWLVEAAQPTSSAVYVRPPRRVYDERTPKPSIEMYRAFGQTLRRRGCHGMYLGYLQWPLAEVEYEILREMACPQAVLRRDKCYLLQPREPGLVFEELLDYGGGYPSKPRRSADEITEAPKRVLPIELKEGETATASIIVSDELEQARADGEMRAPILTIRFAFFCVEDEIVVRFNDRVLSSEGAEITDERALVMAMQPRSSPLEAPLAMSAHWFRYRLDPELLQEGENVVSVEVVGMEPSAGFTRSLNGVEIQMRYRSFERPEGLEVPRIVTQ